MKKITLIILCGLNILIASSQDLQNANWCFGFNAGVNFNTTPASTFTCQITNTNIGMRDVGASVSDNNGNLRFYTDGVNVWDNTHTLMPNGTGLFGYFDAGSFGQSVVIVPKPGNANLYYIFTMSTLYLSFQGASNPVGRGGLHYSIIDMSLNNGKGDVMPNFKNIIMSNHNGTLLDYPLNYAVVNTNPVFINQRSRMTTSLHANGDKIWLSVILDYYYNNQNTRWFYNYPISQNGISNMPDGTSPAPTVFQQLSAANYNATIWGIGGMKVSPNGQFICDVEDVVNLYDYNNQTGSVSFNRQVYNSQTILPGYHSTGYGVEFSPNSEIIYFTDNPDGIIQGNGKSTSPNPSKNYVSLYQYSIQQQATSIIHNYPPPIAPVHAITPIPVEAPFGLQLSIDNKVYLCAFGSLQQYRNYLGVINSPNTLGLGCNFSPTGLQLAPNTFNNGSMPQWVHKATIATWPKVYEWGGYPISSNYSMVTKGNNGSIYYSFHSINIQNNLNHGGLLPSTLNSNFLARYNQNGVSQWTLSDLTDINDVFMLQNGNIRTKINTVSPNYIYLDGITGVQTSGPSYVPADEKMLAETNTGIYITCKTGQIFVHSISSSNNVNIIGEVDKAFFNPLSNKFFVKFGDYLNIYQLVNNNLSLLSSTFNNSGYRLYNVDNQDNIYAYVDVVNGDMQLCYFNLSNPSNPFSPILIPGFTNSGLSYKICLKNNPYVSDYCLVYRNIGKGSPSLYMLNFSSQTGKKIQTNSSFYYEGTLTHPSEFTCSYFANGDDVFIAGQIYAYNQPVAIGSQMFYNVPITSNYGANYLGKFSFQDEFNLKILAQNNLKVAEQNKNFKAILSPNPGRDFLNILISEVQRKPNEIYKISILESNGKVVLQTISNKLFIRQNIISLHTGNYYVTISNSKGEQATLLFIKR